MAGMLKARQLATELGKFHCGQALCKFHSGRSSRCRRIAGGGGFGEWCGPAPAVRARPGCAPGSGGARLYLQTACRWQSQSGNAIGDGTSGQRRAQHPPKGGTRAETELAAGLLYLMAESAAQINGASNFASTLNAKMHYSPLGLCRELRRRIVC